MALTPLQRDTERLRDIRASSIILRGGTRKLDEDVLSVLRYRIVFECRDYIEKEIARLETARAEAVQAGCGAESVALAQIVANLRNLQKSMLNTVGDEANYRKLPHELRQTP